MLGELVQGVMAGKSGSAIGATKLIVFQGILRCLVQDSMYL